MSTVSQKESRRSADTGQGATTTDLPVFLPAPDAGGATQSDLTVRLFQWLRTGTGLFSTVISLLAGTLTVVFLLIPSIKPEGPNTQFTASFADTSIETDVALSDYYARLREVPPSTMSGGDLLQRGVVVSFTVTIEGFKDKECQLVWSVFDSSTNKRSQQDWLVSQKGWPVGIFVPEGNVDQANGEVFVPAPPAAGTYFVRLELNDPDGTRLTTVDSPTFEIVGSSTGPAPIGLTPVTGT